MALPASIIISMTLLLASRLVAEIARVAQSTGIGRLRPLEVKLVHVEPFDERIDYAAQVVGRNKVLQNLGKERALTATFTLDINHRRRCPRVSRNRLSTRCLSHANR